MRGARVTGSVVVALLLSAAAVAAPAADAYTPPPIKHVFVLIDENESGAVTFGAASAAPYLSQTLRAQGAYLPNYYGIGHSSLDNYVALVSGQAPNPDTSGDCPTFSDFPAPAIDAAGQETGRGCVYPADVPTLMGQLDGAGLTWRGYMDGMGDDPAREAATCGHPAVGAADNTEGATAADQYATRHDPFVYFHGVIDNAPACAANVVNLSRLQSDLQSAATTPAYVFITPSLCNDGHDATCANGGPGGLAQADAFLRTWVPRITGSPAFQQNGLLIITFDEAVGDASACCGELPGPYDLAHNVLPGGSGPGGGDVGAVLLSPFIAAGTQSSTSYNHYALLGSVEDLFGLGRLAAAAGTTAFGPDVYTQPSGHPAAPPGSTTPPPPAGPGVPPAAKARCTVPALPRPKHRRFARGVISGLRIVHSGRRASLRLHAIRAARLTLHVTRSGHRPTQSTRAVAACRDYTIGLPGRHGHVGVSAVVAKGVQRTTLAY